MLLRNLDGQRNFTAAFSLDPGRMGRTGGARAAGWWTHLDPLRVTYTGGITSRFNRDAVEPGTLYELGWGSRDDFLLIGADSASTLSERDRVQIRGGVRLPGSTTIRTAYDRSLNQTLDTRSDREALQRVWPDLTGTVADLPLPSFFASAITRLSLGSGYRRETRGLDFGAGNQQDRFREDHAVPLSLGLSLVSGVVVDYRGRLGWGESLDPTGDTKRRRDSHSLTATITTRSPVRAFRVRGAPLRITLSLRYLEDVQCRVTSRLSPCVAFIDELERDGSLSLDSTVRDYQLGVRIRYLDRRSFVGQQAGSTQFQLNVFGQFVLTSALLSNGAAGR